MFNFCKSNSKALTAAMTPWVFLGEAQALNAVVGLSVRQWKHDLQFRLLVANGLD
jgi:hypothetical protein